MPALSLTPRSTLRGGWILAACTSLAGAQDQAWIRQFGSSAHDFASTAAADGGGGAFTAGYTLGSLGGPSAGRYDAWLARYDRVGNQVWLRQFGTSTDDYLYAAASDGSGGVYVCGSTRGALGAPQGGVEDAWLARYDGAGNQVWIRQLGTNQADFSLAAAPDGSGGVYMAGETRGSLGGPSAGDRDAWLARYDGAGNQLWIRQLGTNGRDAAYVAAPSGSSGVYVGGHTQRNLSGQSAGAEDAWLAHYDGAGNQTWLQQFGSSARDFMTAAAPDGAGGVYVTGTTEGALGGQHAGGTDAWLARYDSTGNQTWTLQFGSTSEDLPRAAVPDGAGGVYLGGIQTDQFTFSTVWLSRYDDSGGFTWHQAFGSSASDGVEAAATDGSNGIYVGGYTFGDLGGASGGNADAWIARYDGLVSTRYCSPGTVNSTGQSGRMIATGSNALAANDITLGASRLPLNSFGFFLTSRVQGSTYPFSNSQGRLCLGGTIGRFIEPGQIESSGATGSFSLLIDLTAIPQHPGNVAVQSGDTWNFQAWHRDANPTSTSNFTDAVSVMIH